MISTYWDLGTCICIHDDALLSGLMVNLGSRLIVTTRIKTVAEACCFGHHEHILEMKPLSEEDSRKLFFDRIFCSEEACPGQLRDVSVEILKKCGGLPLAIISISSLLASDRSNQK